jgi:hypothetical protein
MKCARDLSSAALVYFLSVHSGVAISKVPEQVPNATSSAQTQPMIIANPFGIIQLPNLLGTGELVAQSIARLDFSWRSAPRETSALVLQSILNANSNTVAGAATLMATGQDIYIVRVRLSNSGNMRFRVYPQNVIAQYTTRSGRRGSVRAVPVTDSRFFQPDILEPNYYIDKLIAFVAPANLNVVRDFRVGYSDRSIQVRY